MFNMSGECAQTCPFIAWGQSCLDEHERTKDELLEITSGAIAMSVLPEEAALADLEFLGNEGALLFHARGDMEAAAHSYISEYPTALELFTQHAADKARIITQATDLMATAQNTCHGPRERRAILGLVGRKSLVCTAPGFRTFISKYQEAKDNLQKKNDE